MSARPRQARQYCQSRCVRKS